MPFSSRSIRSSETPRVRPALAALGLAAAVGCGSDAIGGPVFPALQPGTYVLTTLAGEPPPFVYYQVNYADSLAIAFTFTFDTVRIVNDSDFTRHFRREVLELRPGFASIVADQEEFNYAGIILHRADEVKLTTRSGSPGGTALAYFALRDSALARHTEMVRYHCLQTVCTLLTNRRVEALYARK